MQHIGFQQRVILVNRQIPALVEQRHRCLGFLTRYVKLVLADSHTVILQSVELRVVSQMLYQRGHCARFKPVVVCFPVIEGVEQTERRIDILAVWREVVSVIVLLQQGVCLAGGYAQSLGIVLNAWPQCRVELLLCYAADAGVVVNHGYLVEVVKLREYAEL